MTSPVSNPYEWEPGDNVTWLDEKWQRRTGVIESVSLYADEDAEMAEVVDDSGEPHQVYVSSLLRPAPTTTDSAEVERLRIALADALGAPHTMTVDEMVDRARELREEFERLASRRYRLELLATGYALGQSHGFARPTRPLSSLARFVDSALAEDVEIPDFQALYERMARGETTAIDLPSAA